MEFGIGDIIDLLVPHYLLITIISPIAAYMVITSELPNGTILPLIFALSFGALGFNTVNMVFDEQIDKLTKPMRPIVTKKINKSHAFALGILFYILSLFISVIVDLRLAILMIIFAILTISYSSPWPYYKKYFWASAVCGAIVYGAIPFIGALIVSNHSLPLHFLLFFTLLFFIISNSKDFEDMDGEKYLHINSVPLIFGVDNAAKILLATIFALLFFTGYSSLTGIIAAKFIYATAISLLLFLPISWLFWKDIQRIKFKSMTFAATKNSKLKDIVSQSDGVTFCILFAILVQLVFGFVAVAL